MLRYILCLTVLSSAFTLSAYAASTTTIQPLAIQKYSTLSPWDVATVELRELPDEAGSAVLIDNDCSKSPSLNSTLDGIDWGTVIAVGEKIWKIVEANKPVVTIQTPIVHALPRGLSCWLDLDSWKAPQVKAYEILYKNLYGMEVVKFRFRLQYTYGGGKASHGQYLANVTVMPAEVNVVWLYTFDAQIEVEQAVNMGSIENPLAGLGLNLKWTVKTVLKESQNSFHFFVQGDGVSSAQN